MRQVLFLQYSFLFFIYYFSVCVYARDFRYIAGVIPESTYDQNNNYQDDDGSYLSFQKHFENITDEEMMAIGGNNENANFEQNKSNLKDTTFDQLKYTQNVFKSILYTTIKNLDFISCNIKKIYSPIDVAMQQKNVINYDIDLKSGYDRFYFLKRDFTKMNIYKTKYPFLYCTIDTNNTVPYAAEIQYYFNFLGQIYCNVVLDIHNLPLQNYISLLDKDDEVEENSTKVKKTKIKYFYYSNYFSNGWSLYINSIYTSPYNRLSAFFHMSFCYLPVREVGGVDSKESMIKISNITRNIDDHDYVHSLHIQNNILFYLQRVFTYCTGYIQVGNTAENNEISITPVKYDTNCNINEEDKQKCEFIQKKTIDFCSLPPIMVEKNIGNKIHEKKDTPERYFTFSDYFINTYVEIGCKNQQIRFFGKFNFKRYIHESTYNKDLSHYFVDCVLYFLSKSNLSILMPSFVKKLFNDIYSITSNRVIKQVKDSGVCELLVGGNAKYIGADVDFNLLTTIDNNWPLYWNINMKYQLGKYVKFNIGYLCRQTDLFHKKYYSGGVGFLKKQQEVPIGIVLNDYKINNKISLEGSLVYLVKINGIYNVRKSNVQILNNIQSNVTGIGNVDVAQNADIISKMTIDFALYIQFSNSVSIKPTISILKKFVNFFGINNVNNNECLDNVPLFDLKLQGSYKNIDLDGKHCTTYGGVIHFISSYRPDMYDVVSQQFYNQSSADNISSSAIPYIDIFLCYKYEDLFIKLSFNNIISIFTRFVQIQSPYYAQSLDIFHIRIQYKLN